MPVASFSPGLHVGNLWRVQVMGGEEELASAVHWLEANLRLDLDVRIHVFELTIRALGAALGCWAELRPWLPSA